MELLKKLKENKEIFSIHSLINKEKLSLENAKTICNLAQKDSEITVFYYIKCPSCEGQNGSGIFSKSLVNSSKKCFFCQKKYKVKISNLEFIFDPNDLNNKL